MELPFIRDAMRNAVLPSMMKCTKMGIGLQMCKQLKDFMTG